MEIKMKKIACLLQMTLALSTYSGLSMADGEHHRHGHGHHHREYGYYPQPAPGYYAQPAPNYYQQPAPVYYQEPRPQYYQQPQYQPDPRSHQGLAGGVIGSVLGYEIGSGDPIAAGLGAAAGSFLGNGMRGR
jgi:hypothetical protein